MAITPHRRKGTAAVLNTQSLCSRYVSKNQAVRQVSVTYNLLGSFMPSSFAVHFTNEILS